MRHLLNIKLPSNEPLINDLQAANLAEEDEHLIKKLKGKCKIADKEDKVKIISLLSASWLREK